MYGMNKMCVFIHLILHLNEISFDISASLFDDNERKENITRVYMARSIKKQQNQIEWIEMNVALFLSFPKISFPFLIMQ